MKRVYVVGTADTKGEELAFVCGRVKAAGAEPLLVDWRAPAAAPFYRATVSEPMGVVRRRLIICKGPEVIDLDDDVLEPDQVGELRVLGEGALQVLLGGAKRIEDERERIAARIVARTAGVLQLTLDLRYQRHSNPGRLAPPRTCQCRWNTVWPPPGPTLTITR